MLFGLIFLGGRGGRERGWIRFFVSTLNVAEFITLDLNYDKFSVQADKL